MENVEQSRDGKSRANFATIDRRSPEGLTLSELGVTEEQHAILQRIAWQAVSACEHSGVKAE